MYDSSEKAQRDRESLVDEAESRGEARGEAKMLRETIHFCQSILGIVQTPIADLELLSVDQLDKIATDLQSQVRGRVI